MRLARDRWLSKYLWLRKVSRLLAHPDFSVVDYFRFAPGSENMRTVDLLRRTID